MSLELHIMNLPVTTRVWFVSVEHTIWGENNFGAYEAFTSNSICYKKCHWKLIQKTCIKQVRASQWQHTHMYIYFTTYVVVPHIFYVHPQTHTQSCFVLLQETYKFKTVDSKLNTLPHVYLECYNSKQRGEALWLTSHFTHSNCTVDSQGRYIVINMSI